MHLPSHPEGGIHSLKQFCIQLLMVVLGILIALGLEQWRESWRHKEIAERALKDIRQELERSQIMVKKTIPRYENAVKINDEALSAQQNAIKALETKSQPVPEPKNENLQIYVISPQSTAWDVATASQAINQIPYEDLIRFSRAYTAQKFIVQSQFTIADGYSKLSELGDFKVNASMEQMKEQLKALNRAKQSLAIALNNYKALDDVYNDALGKPSTASPTPAPKASQ